MIKEESNKKFFTKEKLAVLAGVIIAIIIVLAFLFNGKTTSKNEAKKPAEETSLICSASGINNGIFSTDNAISAEYEINLVFADDELKNLTYTFTGTYDNHATAEAAELRAHADFNIRLGELGLREDEFSSTTFSVIDNQLILTNFATKNEISVESASMLLIDIDKDSADPAIPSTLSELKENYTSRGFICRNGA